MEDISLAAISLLSRCYPLRSPLTPSLHALPISAPVLSSPLSISAHVKISSSRAVGLSLRSKANNKATPASPMPEGQKAVRTPCNFSKISLKFGAYEQAPERKPYFHIEQPLFGMYEARGPPLVAGESPRANGSVGRLLERWEAARALPRTRPVSTVLRCRSRSGRAPAGKAAAVGTGPRRPLLRHPAGCG